MSTVLKLSLPFPPSVNSYWRAPNKGALTGKHLISANGRKYLTNAVADVVTQLNRFPKPRTDLVSVVVILMPPDRKRRDLDNYLKALFDSLTHAGIWCDDSQVKRMLVEWGPVMRGGKAEITISSFEGQHESTV